MNEYRYVKYMFSQGYQFCTEELKIRKKYSAHSDSDFNFDIENTYAKEYIKKHGNDTNIEFFRNRFSQRCKKSCPKGGND